MRRFVSGSLLLIILVALNTKAFAADFDCKFKDEVVRGVKTIQLSDENLFINKELEIPLEKSRVKCGHFGKQTRFDGSALGFQVILKTCSSEAKLEGHLIDSINEVAADIYCQPM